MPEAAVMSASRERVLDAAEGLFAERGYASVTLRDIAGHLGMRQASLYHHVPGGKEALYVEVVERAFARHRQGMEQALDSSAELGGQLQAVARWLLSQPPVDLPRLARSDVPALQSAHGTRITRAASEGVMMPLRQAILSGQQRGEIRDLHPDTVAGAFLALMDGVHQASLHSPLGKDVLADQMVSLLLDGARPTGWQDTAE